MAEKRLYFRHFAALTRQFGCAGVAKVMEPDRPQAVLRKQVPKPLGKRIRPHRPAVLAFENRSGVMPGLALMPAQQRLQARR